MPRSTVSNVIWEPEAYTQRQVLDLFKGLGRAEGDAILGFADFPLIEVNSGSGFEVHHFAEIYAALLKS